MYISAYDTNPSVDGSVSFTVTGADGDTCYAVVSAEIGNAMYYANAYYNIVSITCIAGSVNNFCAGPSTYIDASVPV